MSQFDLLIEMALGSDCTPCFNLNANILYPLFCILIYIFSVLLLVRDIGGWPCTPVYDLLTSLGNSPSLPPPLHLLPPFFSRK